VIAWLVGCVAPGTLPADAPVDPVLTTPAIAAMSVGCDPEASQWTVAAEATSWTGGGKLYWTVDADYVEVHPVGTKTAAPDGSSERLELVLPVAADWREVTPGGSTAFHCSDDVKWRFVLMDLDEVIVDCRYSGEWDGGDGVPECDVPQEE
jgi:hypothetical protein